jgi:hypothetical protein
MRKCIDILIGKTTIKKKPDYDADASYLGEYGDKIKPGCIIVRDKEVYEDIVDNEDYEIPEKSGNYRFFYPPDNGEKIGTHEYKNCALEDLQNVEDLDNQQWGYCAITVKTEVVAKIPSVENVNKYIEMVDTITTSLWGIEDHWDKDSELYIKSTIEDLKEENKQHLLKMGFDEKEIDDSLNNADEVM